MTYSEALKKGYKPLFEKWHRGYISRRIETEKQPVKAAGGRRTGLYYVELPSWQTTNYFTRLYLSAPSGNE